MHPPQATRAQITSPPRSPGPKQRAQPPDAAAEASRRSARASATGIAAPQLGLPSIAVLAALKRTPEFPSRQPKPKRVQALDEAQRDVLRRLFPAGPVSAH